MYRILGNILKFVCGLLVIGACIRGVASDGIGAGLMAGVSMLFALCLGMILLCVLAAIARFLGAIAQGLGITAGLLTILALWGQQGPKAIAIGIAAAFGVFVAANVLGLLGKFVGSVLDGLEEQGRASRPATPSRPLRREGQPMIFNPESGEWERR